ncbi:MAG: YfcC family protein [Anaerolineae bacterium]|nr:YfcC family protein [Anaerolineae bacterium]
METKSGAQISRKAFVQSVAILLALMTIAGLLTLLVPAGSYARVEMEGREVVDPASFQYTARPAYPIWRWFTAPIEVLWSPDSLTIIVVGLFILMVGSAFAVLDASGILRAVLGRVVRALGGRKYLLLLIVTFLFMSLGAFFGLFEEVVPLVPVMIGLSYSMGWDSLVGLGMSILATNLGFSAAITNPFTIGVAQRIAGLPLFSGAWLRVPILLAVYAVLSIFLVRYARRIERDPARSPVFAEDRAGRQKYGGFDLTAPGSQDPRLGRAATWFLAFFALIVLVLVAGPFVPALSDFALPIVGLLFLVGGVGAGLISGFGGRKVLKTLWEGILGIAPGIPLILMAVSIKHIVAQGGILDTILYAASQLFANASPFLAALMVYVLALAIEFFIGSGSAKAFLMMPILVPLADLVGVTRQVTVTAYCFGDGFSNMAYPTSPVLLICLGLTVVTYAKWMRWTLKLWLWVLLLTVIFLGLAVAIGYGPF